MINLFARANLLNLTHDDISLMIAIVNGIVAVWAAKVSHRNKKDIDGVAEVVGTARAKARCAEKDK